MLILKLTAKSLKCTLVVPSDQIAGVDVPNGSPPVPFTITADGRTITGQFNAKSLRRAVAAVAATPGIGSVIIQGNLNRANELENAGISVPQPKITAAAAD
jgi:hypothetical protein